MQRNNFPSDEKDRILRNISNKFKNKKWNVLNTELSLSVQMLEFSYPNEVEEINDILYYIEYYSNNMISSKNVLLNVTNLNDNTNKYHAELRKALWDIINSCQYELFYMPIYSAFEKRIISREPLLKLPTEPTMYISPAELDNITDDYLRLKHIHESIFEDICKYLSEHPCTKDRIEYMNYKITAAQLMQGDMIDNYSFLIRKYQIDYHRLGIEMSESTVSYIQPAILQNIMAMKSYGVTFILDQFGTGYHSLEYFKYLSFEYVKLDKSIVKACLDNDKGLTVLKSMIAMMKQLKVIIIADGVDTKELADLLISLGVDSLEGSYYLSEYGASQ
jgi:EAL domain-containing protein (putative c-di-GMP-specific phosphodiesterase class I)